MLKELWEFAFTEDTHWLRNSLYAGSPPTNMLLKVMPSTLSLNMSDADFADSLIDVKLAFI